MIKIHDRSSFTAAIEQMVAEKKMEYMDAILIYCQQTGIEIESVPKLISQTIKEKLSDEAHALNMLGPKSPSLPFEESE